MAWLSQPSMAIAYVSRSWVLSCAQPACFFKLVADEKLESVALLLGSLFYLNSHWANVSLSKQSVLFLQGVMLVYRTAPAANQHDLVTDMAAAWGEAMELEKE